MSYDRSLPTPLQGVTTLPENVAPAGYMREQTNFRSDAKEGLIRRSQTEWLRLMVGYVSKAGQQIYFYKYDDDVYFVQAYVETNRLYINGWKNEVSEFATSEAYAYGNIANYKFASVYGQLYMWDSLLPVTGTESAIPWGYSSSINITSALNYAETVEIEVFINDITVGMVAHTVPGLIADPNNQPDADLKRATNYVATELATGLGTLLTTTARIEVKGSNVTCQLVNTADKLKFEISTGRGDASFLVFNREIRDPEGLPKYCIQDTVIQVKPGVTNTGAYYLRAEVTDGDASTRYGEVVWVETVSPLEHVVPLFETLPYIIDFDEPAPVTRWLLDEREVGDETSNETPYFFDKNIENITVFQDRVGVLAGDRITFSTVDKPNLFWRFSAVELLVTDTTSVGTTGSESVMRQVVFHNRDLLAFAQDAQFKITGQEAVTPQSVAMALTTSNDCYISIPPVQMQSAVYFCALEGNSVGVYKYAVEADTNIDTAGDITANVIGYIKGKPTIMKANANSTMLVVKTDVVENELYIYEQHTSGKDVYNSWCKWVLPADMVLIDFFIDSNILQLYVTNPGVAEIQRLDMNLRGTDIAERYKVYVDNAVSMVQTAGEWKLPVGYTDGDLTNSTVVAIDAGELSMHDVDFTVELISGGYKIVPEAEVPASARLVVGIPFDSSFTMNRVYDRHQDGTPRELDRLRIRDYLVGVSNTYALTMELTSIYGDVTEWPVTSSSYTFAQEYFDTLTPVTEEWDFPIGMRSDEYVAKFKSVAHLPCTIAYISYRAQSFSTRTRR